MSFRSKIQINNQWYSRENYHQLLHQQDEEPWKIALADFLSDWFDNNDFIEIQTSGSTGEPKNLRLRKQSMINSAAMTCQYFNLTEESTALLCLPADYIAGKMMIIRAFVSGMNLITIRPSANPFENLDAIIDFAAITPYQFINSYQSIQVAAIRKIIIGGSQVSMRLQKMMEDLDAEIYETYGMTETCSHIALRKLNGNKVSEYFEVLPGIEIKTDKRNCLVIKAPVLTNDELVTNDVVEIYNDTHFKWLGRFDNVVNSGGIKIFPEQLEKKIEPYIDRRFFIGAISDEELTQKLILVIEGSPFSKSEYEKLQLILHTFLSKYEKPKEVLFKEQFEVSSSGKILKQKILKQIE